MFKKIIVPIEALRLGEPDVLAGARKAMDVAADLAKRHGATLVLATVEPLPEPPISPMGETLHFDVDVETPLNDHAAAEAARLGLPLETAHRPSPVVSSGIREMVEELGADLVVMGTHQPSAFDWLLGSNASATALHTGCSVFVVR